MAESEELTSLERETAEVVPGSGPAEPESSENEGTLTSTDGDSETEPTEAEVEAKKAEEAKAAAEARKARTKKRIKDLAAENKTLKERLESQGVTSGQDQPGVGKPPKAGDFDDYQTFDAARRQYEVRQAIDAERRKEAEQRERRTAAEAHQAFVEKWTAIAEAAAEKYDDGDDVMEHFTSEAMMHPVAAQALVESELGADIAYHLATNPKELESFEKLSPFAQAKRIGFLEAKLEGQSEKESGAPPPPSRPGQSRQTGNPNWKSDPKTDTEDWIRRRQKEVHRR